MKKVEITKNDLLGQLDFIQHNIDKISKVWLDNKDKKGYVQIYATKDYLNHYGLKFVQQHHVVKYTFNDLLVKQAKGIPTEIVYVEFLWEKTYTKYRAAIPITAIVLDEEIGLN
jgi:hypothetical protein